MRLQTRLVEQWPKLAWCARVNRQELNVLHGPRVETAEDWIFEGAWAGDFGAGDFDQGVAAVVGTGLHLRGGEVSFAASMNALDRLYYIEQSGEKTVSNSLACLLAVSGARLAPNYLHSDALIRCIRDFRATPRSLPTEEGCDIHVHRYGHLVCADGNITCRPRADPAPRFETFEEYREFLDDTVLAIKRNLRNPGRRFPITPAATISNGYDSSAAAVVAEPLDIQFALTISRGGVFSQLPDSGERVAEKLGLPIKRTKQRDSGYKEHVLIWAGTGRSLDLNMTLFDLPDDLTLLTIGNHGDVIWDKALDAEYQEAHHFLDREPSGTGLVEWRLHRGVFLAAVPYFGASRWDCLRKIHASDAMDPWRVGGNYDRPIPRRIVEQRGIERDAFGRRKTQTASRPIHHPRDREQLRSLTDYLVRHGEKLPRRFGFLQRPIDALTSIVVSRLGWEPRDDHRDLYFTWANTYLAENTYRL